MAVKDNIGMSSVAVSFLAVFILTALFSMLFSFIEID
jgi:hypothetical protein